MTPTTSGSSRSTRRRAACARSRRCVALAARSCAIASPAERLPSDLRKTGMPPNLATRRRLLLPGNERHAGAVPGKGVGAAPHTGDDARHLCLTQRPGEDPRAPAAAVDLPLEGVALKGAVLVQGSL